MQHTFYTERFATHPDDVKRYGTSDLRNHFLISHLFAANTVNMVYSHFDRFIAGAAVPLSHALVLESIEPLKAAYFLERRELGIINIGGTGIVTADGVPYTIAGKEALYLGMGNKHITFESINPLQPAHFYFNSALAHQPYDNKHVTFEMAEVLKVGSRETSNERTINKLIVHSLVKTCQLQMGLTELQPGSVWNTMPPHVHARRMEVYMYFNVPDNHAICHYMGQPTETRHIWVTNEQAVISPDWSVHSGAGTCNYSFIWGMAGENLDYNDMDTVQPFELK